MEAAAPVRLPLSAAACRRTVSEKQGKVALFCYQAPMTNKSNLLQSHNIVTHTVTWFPYSRAGKCIGSTLIYFFVIDVELGELKAR